MSDVRVEIITTVVVKGWGRHRQADKACEAWVAKTNDKWWRKKSPHLPRPDAYAIFTDRYNKLYRRALPIFKKVLP